MDSIVLFFVTLVVGASLGAMAWISKGMAESRGYVLRWWHWLLMAIGMIFFVLTFAWFGTMLGEGPFTQQAAWQGGLVGLVITAIIAIVLWRLILVSKSTES